MMLLMSVSIDFFTIAFLKDIKSTDIFIYKGFFNLVNLIVNHKKKLARYAKLL